MVNDISNTVSGQGSMTPSADSQPSSSQMQAQSRPAVSQAVTVVETARPSESVQATPSAQALNETVSRLNEAVQVVKRDLQFRVDDESGRTVITVLDSETEEVIRQIPPEQVLTLAKNIESLKGLLFTAEA